MDSPGALGVSRETFDRLKTCVDLLVRWNSKINLVSRSTVDDVWSRHIVDSVQVYRTLDKPFAHWADLGSGGGFPGLVVAILAAEGQPDAKVTLVESDQRKSTFLRTVLRETGVTAQVMAQRIESVRPLTADVLSARALADLSALLGFAERHLATDGTCVFPKGKNWRSEVQTACENWKFSYDMVPSLTDSEAVVLKIKGIARV